MDALDIILTDAWNRMSKRLRENRVSALKRSRRRFKGVLTRPMREWCLVIRASDTRITAGNALIDACGERAIPHPEGEGELAAIGRHEPHTLLLTGKLIRELTKPITIPWPGVTYEEAAKICGREYKTMKGWILRSSKKGHFKIDYYREFKFPESTRRSKNGQSGRPYVWTPSPIDPNNFEGRAPHPVWGTLWQWMWEKLPQEHEFEVQRVPMTRMRNGKECFRGWNFVCPGRLDVEGNLTGCGRRCTYLYAPQTMWTLAQALCDGSETGFELPPPEVSGLTGEWFPGMSDPVKDATHGMRSFACKECWRVRSACMAKSDGWNEFVSQISGGLLYGRDVPRPAEICPVKRKKREYRWKRPHPRKRVQLPEQQVEAMSA
jgi:hypothetical protein